MPADQTSSQLPLISVITPSFNAFPYLQETVESVRRQAYPRVEHIIMDGGSTDGTLEYLQSQPDLIWQSGPDRGQSHALNKGFGICRGEIIGWLNADDFYQPGVFDLVSAYFHGHPEADVLYGDIHIIDQYNQKVGISKGRPFDLEMHLLVNYVNQPTVFMHRRVLEAVGGVDEGLQYVMDRELWLRIGLAGFKFAYLDTALANFRLQPGTKSYDQSTSFKNEWRAVVQNIFDLGGFPHFPREQKKELLDKINAQYHLSMASRSTGRRVRLRYLAKAIGADRQLLRNRGLVLLLWKIMVGKQMGELRRF